MTHHTLTTQAEISAYLHRNRMAILEALRTQPATVSQIATIMNVHPANLTRHMRILEQANLITLVEKRDTGRNLEKYYAAIAKSFDVAPEENLTNKHKIALNMVRSDISAALAYLPDDDIDATVLLSHARISAENIELFSNELSKLTKRFQSTDDESGISYSLNLSLYPSNIETPPVQKIYLSKKDNK